MNYFLLAVVVPICVNSHKIANQMDPTPEKYLGPKPEVSFRNPLKYCRTDICIVYNITAVYNNPRYTGSFEDIDRTLERNLEEITKEARKDFIEFLKLYLRYPVYTEYIPTEIFKMITQVGFRTSVIFTLPDVKRIFPDLTNYNQGHEAELKLHIDKAITGYHVLMRKTRFSQIEVDFHGPFTLNDRYLLSFTLREKRNVDPMQIFQAFDKPYSELLDSFRKESNKALTRTIENGAIIRHVAVEYCIPMHIYDAGSFIGDGYTIDGLMYINQRRRNMLHRFKALNQDYQILSNIVTPQNFEIQIRPYTPALTERFMYVTFGSYMYSKSGRPRSRWIFYDLEPYKNLVKDTLKYIMKMAHVSIAVSGEPHIEFSVTWFTYIWGTFSVKFDVIKLRTLQSEFYLPNFGPFLADKLEEVSSLNFIPLFGPITFVE